MKLILLLASLCLVASANMGGPHNSTQPRPRRHLDSSSSSSDSNSYDLRRPGGVVEVVDPIVVVEQSPAAATSQYRQKRSVAPNPTQIRNTRQVIVPGPIDTSSDSDSDEIDNVAVVNPVVVVEQDPALVPRQKRAAPANTTLPRPRRHLDSSSSSSSSESDEFRRPQEIDVINPVVVVEQTPAPLIVGQGAWPAPNAAQIRSRRQVVVPAPLSPIVPIDASSDSDSDDDDDVAVVNPVVVVEEPVLVPRQKRAAPANTTQIRNTRQVLVPVPVAPLDSSDSDSDELDNVAVVNPVVVVEQDPALTVIQKRSVPANATQKH